MLFKKRKKKHLIHHHAQIVTINNRDYITDGYYKIPLDTFKLIATHIPTTDAKENK